MSLGFARSFIGGRRDARRRRLFGDEPADSTDWPTDSVRSETDPDRAYEDVDPSAFGPLVPMIPRRWFSIVGILAAGALVIAGLEVAHAWMLGLATPVTALTIDAKGSLACWFSSLMLLAAALAALAVYGIRRHRLDDYQGRYRVWLWAAGFWFLMATDQAASLREAFRDLMTGLTGVALAGDAAFWWITVYVLLGIALGSRLLSDMRPCRWSMAALLMAAASLGLALADRMGLIFYEIGPRTVMFRAGCEMAGNLLVLTAMLLYARHVLREAEGLLPKQNRAEEDPTPSRPDPPVISKSKRWLKVDPPHTTPPPANPRPATVAAASTPTPVNRKLTKAERKALKRRLLQQRAERESG